MRYQDPKIEEHGKHWRIRPFVTTVQADGTVKRKRTPIILGYTDVMTLSEAKRQKQKVMATINAGRIVVQAQIGMATVIDKFVEVRLPLLGSATQAKYRSHIDNHIRPAFRKSRGLTLGWRT